MPEFPLTPSLESDDPEEDLYPVAEDERRKVERWIEQVYIVAKADKTQHQERWDKYYKMYRSFVKKRKKGDWKSRVWMPIAFYVIETITPRLVAQLPDFTVLPVGPEDTQGAELMETLLKWSQEQSDLYLELVKVLKSALMYGTGILKTSYMERQRWQITREPEMQEQTSQVPMMGMTDIDGNPMVQTVSQAVPTGRKIVVRRPYVAYAGPVAEAVNIDDFFVDPVASCIEDARYVIHRVFRDKRHLEDFFKRGIYKRPPEDVWTSFITEHSAVRKRQLIDLSPGLQNANAMDAELVQLLEVWTDDVIMTVAGGDQGGTMLLRAERNPYAHGEKPFVRIVDHLVPHEFWGIGELEPLEGLQDVLNALWNSRIDNVKLVLNTMFLAVMDYIEDPSDLQVRPAGIVRVREGVPLNQAVQPLELGEVTSSSYTEGAEIERMTEKVSGVSLFMGGQEAPASLSRTATGIALVSEQGNTRFSHKVRIAELTGFKHLARQYASIIQQFAPDEIVVRLYGPLGQLAWQQIPADAIGGRYDFSIETESSAQTESIRKEQALSLFQMLAADPYAKPLKIREDVLKVFGRKNVQDYILTEEELQQLYAAQAAAQQQGVAGEEPAQSQP